MEEMIVQGGNRLTGTVKIEGQKCCSTYLSGKLISGRRNNDINKCTDPFRCINNERSDSAFKCRNRF